MKVELKCNGITQNYSNVEKVRLNQGIFKPKRKSETVLNIDMPDKTISLKCTDVDYCIINK